MGAFVLFLVGHVTMVAVTEFVRNMNHIVVGTDETSLTGVYLGVLGLGGIVAVNVLAHWLAWQQPRFVQHVATAIVTPAMKFLLDWPAPVAEFRREDISPFFWANGKMPTCEEWMALADNHCKDYRLKVYGLVDNPAELLGDLRALGRKTQITLNHCIQGWSGIAEWSGCRWRNLSNWFGRNPMRANRLPLFGDGVEFTTGESCGRYYDSLSMANAMHPHTLLAYEMNGEPLPVCTAPRCGLRVENQPPSW
jgi:hypothetical protein